jgi:hypothetical protein
MSLEDKVTKVVYLSESDEGIKVYVPTKSGNQCFEIDVLSLLTDREIADIAASYGVEDVDRDVAIDIIRIARNGIPIGPALMAGVGSSLGSYVGASILCTTLLIICIVLVVGGSLVVYFA